MSIVTYSWADLGFRRLAQLTTGGIGITPTQLAERLSRLGGYDVTPDGWIRRPGRKRNGHVDSAIEVIETFDRYRPSTDDRLAFIDRHFTTEWENLDVPRFTTESAVLTHPIVTGSGIRENSDPRRRVGLLTCPAFRKAAQSRRLH